MTIVIMVLVIRMFFQKILRPYPLRFSVFFIKITDFYRNFKKTAGNLCVFLLKSHMISFALLKSAREMCDFNKKYFFLHTKENTIFPTQSHRIPCSLHHLTASTERTASEPSFAIFY